MKKNYTIEEGFLRLEEIEASLSDPKLPLEQAMKLFEEGSDILRQCTQKLNQAKEKIEELSRITVLEKNENSLGDKDNVEQ